MPNVINSVHALSPVGPAGLTDYEIVLRALLAEGPRASRELLLEFAARGFTPKQARTGRERQGVVVERAGFGSAARSTWRMPMLPSAPTPALAGDYVRASARNTGKRLRKPKTPEVSTAQPTPTDETPAELARMAGRIEAFRHRGVSALEAEVIAQRLLAADRENRKALGSCVQCCSWRRGECPLTPKPIAEIHVCWFLRQETP